MQQHEPQRALAERRRILIADDDRDAVATLAALLVDEGHDVREVYRGDAVLHYLREFRPHVIIADINMPGMSGYEVARQVHELFGVERPLLVAVTGWYKASADRILGQIAGFDHYVTKPYDPAELLRRVAAPAIERRPTRGA
jgi:DNA-binding response OmpR family regulator